MTFVDNVALSKITWCIAETAVYINQYIMSDIVAKLDVTTSSCKGLFNNLVDLINGYCKIFKVDFLDSTSKSIIFLQTHGEKYKARLSG